MVRIACRALAIGVVALVAVGYRDLRPAFAEEHAAPSTASLYTTALTDLHDRPQTLEAYKGKVSVVYFWATWCAPCRIETPRLVALSERFKDKGVVVIGIALDKGDKVRAFTKTMGVTYPIFFGGSNVTGLGRDLGNDLGAIPFTVVVDKSGGIVGTIKGEASEGSLEAILEPLVD